MIFIGVGANLPARGFEGPLATCMAALERLAAHPDIRVARVSPWYRTAPVPISDQPWFVNAVAEVRTTLSPADLLAALHEVEAEFGRVRHVRNEARPLDLDLIAYDDQVIGETAEEGAGGLILPHPRLAARAFVLLPLSDLAPEWRHPATGRSLSAMIADLPPDQAIERIFKE